MQLFRPHDVRHHRRARRNAERRGDANAQRQHVEDWQRQAADKDERRQRAEQRGVDVFGQHEHLLGRVAIDHGAADQDEQRARHADEREHRAQHQRIARHGEHQPGQRDQRELIAQQRQAAAADQPAEIAVAPKRGARREVGIIRWRHGPALLGVGANGVFRSATG